MLEPIYPIATIGAGACIALAIVAIGDRAQGVDATAWLERARHPQEGPSSQTPGPWSNALAATGMHARLADLVERAGWSETPERLSAFALCLSASLGVVGAASASVMG